MLKTGLTRVMLAGALILAVTVYADDDGEADVADGSTTTPGRAGERADDSMEPIVIGFINQDGATPAYPDATLGTEATVEYINAELGGVAGRPIELRTCLIESIEEEALTCAQEMANDDDVLFVTTGYVGPSAPIYTTLADAGKYVIGGSPGTTQDTMAENAIFWDPGGSALSTAIVQFASEHVEFDSLGVMHLSGLLGQSSMGVVNPMLDVLREEGVDIVTAENELDGTTTRIAAATLGDVDAIVALVSEPVCVQLAQAKPTLSIADAEVISSGSCLASSVRDVVGDEALDGWYSVTLTPHPELQDDPEIDEYQRVLDEYGDSDSVHALSVRKYTDMMAIHTILTEMVEEGAELTPESIYDAAFNFTGPLIAGPPAVECPGPSVMPAVCVAQVRVAHFKDGVFTDALDGEFLPVPIATE